MRVISRDFDHPADPLVDHILTALWGRAKKLRQ